MRYLFIYIIIHFIACLNAQLPIEPSKMKSFNITVNHDDCTIKTQMLSTNKKMDAKSELTYLWYSSQKIMETKGGYDGKLIHGFYKSFYLNNQLKEQGTIKYGVKHKEWKFWYSDGSLRELITWKNGVKTGKYCIYNDMGQLMAKGNFKNDKLNGTFITYNSSGNVIDKKKYKNGMELVPKPKKVKEKKQKEINPERKEKPKKEKKLKNKKKDSKTELKKNKVVHT